MFNKDILPKYFGQDKYDLFATNMRQYSFYVFYSNNNKTHESDNVNDAVDILTLKYDAKSTRKIKERRLILFCIEFLQAICMRKSFILRTVK